MNEQEKILLDSIPPLNKSNIHRKKICVLCSDNKDSVNYKRPNLNNIQLIVCPNCKESLPFNI